MDEERYRYRDERNGRGGGRRESQQYPILQPQFKQPFRPIAPRDRFRAPRHEPAFDRVDDEDDQYEEPVFDSFGKWLLHQPVDDRRRLAEKGQSRLSFDPSYPQPSYRPRESVAYDLDGQFAYTATQPQESSSDVPLGPSSSPAFRAGQRRTDHDYVNDAQPRSYPRIVEREEIRTPPNVSQDRSCHRPQASLPAPNVPAARSGAPMVQGIELIQPNVLPDRLRTLFPYPTFNAVQSKCFDHLYKSDDNFVLASPTGSGKTVILEFAICRAIAMNATGQYKIVYQAPMKALCSERQRDWQKKFGPLGLNCVELTGDSNAADLKNVQSANIIVTTPEKWDSVTRKWKDHEKLMRLIKLFLIDEVHILKENRGAILEAVVSRMKSVGTDVRFVALSATIPNFVDVATWLGRNSIEPHEPAMNEKFGEEFRPVKLRKHVCGYGGNPNDFAFEKTLDSQLPEVIKRYTERKPIMIFCNTRKSTVATARLLANWWATRHPMDRPWNAPSTALTFNDRDLRECAASGVAFHHGGVDANHRLAVEKAFLNNEIGVICCTSTLAVGVNLPCHMVIIKNTVAYVDGELQEYSDLEIMQMLGRAGRPQFENSAVAVIMTRQAKVHKYEKMVTGKELLESTLHLNLVDHLNAEIGLGTIRDFQSARKWFASTFLYVRLKQNPAYYKLDGSRSGQSIDEQLDDICFRDITLLRECNLTVGEEEFSCTEFGHIMARYYIHFESMRVIMGLQPKASISEILSAIAQAAELENIRFRQGEKPLYKLINKSPCTRFPIPVDLALPAHKISLLIQSILGAMDIPWDGEMSKHRNQYNTEANVAFRALSRVIRCIIDCQIALGDSVSINNALVLERSIAARVWDDSPSQMKQIDNLGVVAIRKLVNAGIRSIEELECVEPSRIEFLLGRNPPFGLKIIETLKTFPKLRVSLSMVPNSITKTPEGVKVMIKTDIGFINDSVPTNFGSKLVYVCMLAETSDGRMAHFARTSSRKLGKGQQQTLPVLLRSPGLSINCYIMCDSIAGTQRTASVTPRIAPSMFPPPKPSVPTGSRPNLPTPNMSRRRSDSGKSVGKASTTAEEFGDDGIDDEELVKAAISDLDFDHIDNYADATATLTRGNTAKNASSKNKSRAKDPHNDDLEPTQLANGKWACNHSCKNKQACKHMCCKEGMDKPSKKTGAKRVPSNEDRGQPASKVTDKAKSTQTKLQLTSSKRKSSVAVEELDLTQQEKNRKAEYSISGPKESRDLHKLHKSVHKQDLPPSISSVMHTKPEYCYAKGGDHNLSFMDDRPSSSDYGDIQLEDLYDNLRRPQQKYAQGAGGRAQYDHVSIAFMGSPVADTAVDQQSDTFGDDESAFGDAMVGITNSEDVQPDGAMGRSDDALQAFENALDEDYDFGFPDDDYPLDLGDAPKTNNGLTAAVEGPPMASTLDVPMGPPPPKKRHPVFLDDTSSPHPTQNHFKPAKSMSKVSALKESKHTNKNLHTPQRRISSEKKKVFDKKKTGSKYEEVFDDDDVVLGEGDIMMNENEKPPTPEAYKGLEPWLFREFGDIVEIVEE
ncbi:P-loop containing nucleoside triphosphate hydrolase protein [Byssothecium circinans]|uniref:DNA 3'-5' helicase n=1 Tax=Byssothecium circinans TaxID=147558 RepID=A0A6A5U229_9PLEO|nr:P-loop containing nucleoside triphosphate hydrolase protein [Byssothecium circinans]